MGVDPGGEIRGGLTPASYWDLINSLLLRLQERGKRHQKGMRDRRVYSQPLHIFA